MDLAKSETHDLKAAELQKVSKGKPKIENVIAAGWIKILFDFVIHFITSEFEDFHSAR